MSTQPVAVVVVSSPSSSGTASKPANLREPQQTTLPSTIVPESLQCNEQSVNIPEVTRSTISTISPTDDRELAQLLHGVDEPFNSILKRYHLSKRNIQNEEEQSLSTIRTHHRSLQEFAKSISTHQHTQYEIDRLMDFHTTQLRTSDDDLDFWSACRDWENSFMVNGNERMMAEHSHRMAEHAKREADARVWLAYDGRDRWTSPKKEARMQEYSQYRKTYARWQEEFKIWGRTLARYRKDDQVRAREHDVLFIRQAGFTRLIGNYQISRYFEEVEMLNAKHAGPVEAEEHVGQVRGLRGNRRELSYWRRVSIERMGDMGESEMERVRRSTSRGNQRIGEELLVR